MNPLKNSRMFLSVLALFVSNVAGEFVSPTPFPTPLPTIGARVEPAAAITCTHTDCDFVTSNDDFTCYLSPPHNKYFLGSPSQCACEDYAEALNQLAFTCYGPSGQGDNTSRFACTTIDQSGVWALSRTDNAMSNLEVRTYVNDLLRINNMGSSPEPKPIGAELGQLLSVEVGPDYIGNGPGGSICEDSGPAALCNSNDVCNQPLFADQCEMTCGACTPRTDGSTVVSSCNRTADLLNAMISNKCQGTSDCLSDAPTTSPTTTPTVSPTTSPTVSPTTSPTVSPTAAPTPSPTPAPTTAAPTPSPTPSPTTTAPTPSPTPSPTTTAPTPSPTTTAPTPSPTLSPSPSPTRDCTAIACVRDCNQHCGWNNHTAACEDGAFTNPEEFAAGYGCPSESDCNTNCGANGVANYSGAVGYRLKGSLQYKIGKQTKVDAATDCANACDSDATCKSFEVKSLTPVTVAGVLIARTKVRCYLKFASPADVGVAQSTRNKTPRYTLFTPCTMCPDR